MRLKPFTIPVTRMIEYINKIEFRIIRDKMKNVQLEILFKLRLSVARFGEMDGARSDSPVYMVPSFSAAITKARKPEWTVKPILFIHRWKKRKIRRKQACPIRPANRQQWKPPDESLLGFTYTALIENRCQMKLLKKRINGSVYLF